MLGIIIVSLLTRSIVRESPNGSWVIINIRLSEYPQR
jgi:hypothetical protein